MQSCDPPITVPAWACMSTGFDPGVLGCYGFHDRANYGYTQRRLASSLSFHKPTLWQLLSDAGLRCRILGLPQTYPAKPLNGWIRTGALTPEQAAPYHVYPADHPDAQTLEMRNYIADIQNFRTLSATALWEAVCQMTAQNFALAQTWLQQDDWDFFWMVDMGADRLQHGLWPTSTHAQVPQDALEFHAVQRYYRQLDAHLGVLLQTMRDDDVILVVSDHGAQRMQGGIALNDWLIQTGRLTPTAAAQKKTGVQDLVPEDVDWQKTSAWADGGYAGRIYFNVRGREPQGTLDAAACPMFAKKLEDEISQLPAVHASKHTVLYPHQIYQACNRIGPDLLVYFSDLALRALGSWGHAQLLVTQNDRGHDIANHALHGVLVSNQKIKARQVSLYDVAPTILRHFNLTVPAQMRGQPLW